MYVFIFGPAALEACECSASLAKLVPINIFKFLYFGHICNSYKVCFTAQVLIFMNNSVLIDFEVPCVVVKHTYWQAYPEL